ncbi:Aldo/keto reductase [Suillus weaverae]|nr:Aldo/keto reductase [Suillus weaverae]
MSLYQLPPKPPTKLGIYRTLAPTAGVHVSPLALRAMSIGDKWHQYRMGAMDKQSSVKMAEKRGICDQLVIATKYTNSFKRGSNEAQKVNFTGNNIKSMRLSVEASLRKLRTAYTDNLYLHWRDFDTSVEEVMNGLHILVQQGKVLYLGISGIPAWTVTKANQYARDHGKTPSVIYQGMWNTLERSFERDIIPMARAEGMTLAPWNVLASGKFRTDEEEERRREAEEKGREMLTRGWERTENEKKMSHGLEKVAKEVGASHITAVAIAYVMQKTPYVFPFALDISLSQEQIQYLESIIPFDLGLPTSVGDVAHLLLSHTAHFEKVPRVEPIRPSKK